MNINKTKLKHNESGFSHIEIIIVLIVVAIIGIIGFTIYQKNNKKTLGSTSTKSFAATAANPVDNQILSFTINTGKYSGTVLTATACKIPTVTIGTLWKILTTFSSSKPISPVTDIYAGVTDLAGDPTTNPSVVYSSNSLTDWSLGVAQGNSFWVHPNEPNYLQWYFGQQGVTGNNVSKYLQAKSLKNC
jgi:competence protein ComGC